MKTIHWIIIGSAIAIFGAMAGSGAFAGKPAQQNCSYTYQYNIGTQRYEQTGWVCK